MLPRLSIILLALCFAHVTEAGDTIAVPKRAITSASPSAEYECGTIPGSDAENLCIDRRINVLDAELNRVYKRALSRLPKRDSQDIRREQGQLRKSQLAWLKYMDENCNLVGGLDSDSAQAITFNSLMCRENELRERIKFLRNIADASN